MEDQSPKTVHTLDGGVISKYELDCLREYLGIVRNNHGCTTPVDHFITSIVSHHAYRAMTPEMIDEDVAEMKENFTPAMKEVALVLGQYPEQIAALMPKGFTLPVPLPK